MEGLEKAVVAAEEGAESTRDIPALAGRSNYLDESVIRGVPDPGAKAAAIMLRALAGAVWTSS